MRSNLLWNLSIRATFIFLLFTTTLFAQPTSSVIGEVTMPTANAAALGKYIDVPVSLHTGVPDVSIPIHTLQEGELSAAVTLRYHGSGLKVGEVASRVGAGWSLHTGGTISRTTQGIPDERPDGYIQDVTNLNSFNPVVDWKNASRGLIDTEPDLFHFSAGGYSGRFFYTPDGWQAVPKQNILIEEFIVNSQINGFIITTPDGVRRYYGKFGFEDGLELTKSRHPFEDPINGDYYTASTWHLVRIESADRLKQINYTYEDSNYSYKYLQSCSRQWRTAISGSGMCIDAENGIDCPSDNGYYINEVKGKALKSISNSTTFIDFLNAPTLRTDVDAPELDILSAFPLAAIQIYKVTTSPPSSKQFVFNQDYFIDPDPDVSATSESKRLRLNSVQEIGSGASVPPHTFTYVNNNLNFAPHRLNKAIDHWGFYNGTTVNDNLNNLAPQTTVGGFTFGSAQRESNEQYMGVAMLEKITYPTGGHTAFEWEGNRVFAPNSVVQPIFDMESCPVNAPNTCCPTSSTTFTHTFTADQLISPTYSAAIHNVANINDNSDPCTSVCSGGSIMLIEFELTITDNMNNQVGTPFFTTYAYQDGFPQMQMVQDPNLDNLLASLSPGIPYTFELKSNCGRTTFNMEYLVDANRIVGGMRVKRVKQFDPYSNLTISKKYDYNEFAASTQSSGELYIEPRYGYNYILNGVGFSVNYNVTHIGSSSIVPLSDLNGYHIAYREVTETHEGNNGYIRHQFDFETAPTIFSNPMTYPVPPFPNAVKNGKLVNQKTFNQIGGVLEKEVIIDGTDSSGGNYQSYGYRFVYEEFCLEGFVHKLPYLLNTEWYRVTKHTTILDGVESVTETDYDLSNEHYFPINTQMINSDGKIHKTSYEYAFDKTGAIYDELINRNIVATPMETTIEVIDGATTTQTGRQRNHFNTYDSNGDPSGIINTTDPIHLSSVDVYEMTWDANGNSIGAWENNAVTYNKYTPDGYVQQLTQKYWQPETFEWTDGLLTKRTYLNHERVYQYYTSSDLLEQFTDIDGQVITYEYDGLFRPSKITARSGNVVTNLDYNYQSGVITDNYVRTATHYTTVTESDLDSVVTFNYFDGLGRGIQTVQQQHYILGTNSYDVATAVEYDNQGRLIRQYEPYQTVNTTGAYDSGYTTEPYTFIEYYSSPLNRKRRTTPPNWHTTNYAYGSNTTALVDASIGFNYPTDELFYTLITDPNGNKNHSYTDKRGRVVKSSRTDELEYQEVATRFDYDDKDRLKYVFPPSANLSTLGLLYKYLYDKDNNIINKVIPDADPMEYVYDDRNLMTGMRNGVLMNNTEWLVMHYDDYGRDTKTGLFSGASIANPNLPTISTSLKNNFYDTHPNVPTLAINTGKLLRSEVKLLDDNGTNNTWINRTYAYDIDGRLIREYGSSHLNSTETGVGFAAEVYDYDYDYADNPIQVFRTHTIDDIQYLGINQTNNFDHEGRKIRMDFSPQGVQPQICALEYTSKDQLKTKYLGFLAPFSTTYLQKVDYIYNDQGWLTGINNVDSGAGEASMDCGIISTANSSFLPMGNTNMDLFSLQIRYDNPDSNTNVADQRNGNISQAVWRTNGRFRKTYTYSYDYLDRLTSADYGEYDDAFGSTFDPTEEYNGAYSYDSRGNIITLNREGKKSVNDCYEQGTIDELVYDYFPNSNRIQTISDVANPDCMPEKYLTQDITSLEEHSARNLVNGVNTIKRGANVDYYAENCVELDPEFEVELGATFHGYIEPCGDGQIDFSSEGFAHNSTADYEYDDAGNMTYDPNKDFHIFYNYLSLPYKIVSGDGTKEIKFAYDANGIKRSKEVIENGNTLYIQHYLDGIEYRNDTIDAAYHSEGRVVNKGSTSNTDWECHFYLTDHLGNNRVVFKESPLNAGEAMIIQENEFYPFGMAQKGVYEDESSNAYGFGNKELNTDFGLDWQDFGARFYDSAIVRWGQIDPLAEADYSISPYSYVRNNPILLIDPSGMTADTAWVPTRQWGAEDDQGFQDFVDSEVTNMQQNEEKSDCADLACKLLIRYASKEGLEVEFTSTNGKTLNSTTDSSTSPEGFEKKVNNSTNAESLVNNDLVKITGNPSPGDIRADEVHVDVVTSPRSDRTYPSDRIASASGSIPERTPKPSSLDRRNTYRTFAPIARARQKQWNKQKAIQRKRDLLGPLK